MNADLVIGADGARSVVRRAIVDYEEPFEATGLSCHTFVFCFTCIIVSLMTLQLHRPVIEDERRSSFESACRLSGASCRADLMKAPSSCFFLFVVEAMARQWKLRYHFHNCTLFVPLLHLSYFYLRQNSKECGVYLCSRGSEDTRYNWEGTSSPSRVSCHFSNYDRR